jgi:hypothetical protein
LELTVLFLDLSIGRFVDLTDPAAAPRRRVENREIVKSPNRQMTSGHRRSCPAAG